MQSQEETAKELVSPERLFIKLKKLEQLSRILGPSSENTKFQVRYPLSMTENQTLSLPFAVCR